MFELLDEPTKIKTAEGSIHMSFQFAGFWKSEEPQMGQTRYLSKLSICLVREKWSLSYCHSVVWHVHHRNELCDFSFFFFHSCILADVYCTWHCQTCSQVQLFYCWFILPCLQNIYGGPCGNVLLLSNVSLCLLLNTKEVVRPVSAAIQNQNSQFCFKNLTVSLFFFSNLFHSLPNARRRLSLSSISKPDRFLAGSPLYNSTFKFRNRDFPLIF